jgi:hypothetical protein
MTTLMEELRLAVQEILQSMGLGGSANTAATVVPVLMLGIALNVIALGVVDRVHPMRAKTRLVCAARAEYSHVQSVTICVLRQIEGRQRGMCSAKQWASSRLAEMVRCRTATRSGHAAGAQRKAFAAHCSSRSNAVVGAEETLRAI